MGLRAKEDAHLHSARTQEATHSQLAFALGQPGVVRGLRAQCRSHVGASLAEPTPLSTRAQDPCAASSIALADLCVSRMSCFASPSAEVGRGQRWGWAGGFKMSNSGAKTQSRHSTVDTHRQFTTVRGVSGSPSPGLQ